MKFKHKLYYYQQDVLDIFQKEIDRWDKKIHIVAPPWSGKTIMGLEMISKINWNHLILVPNITLQYQWKDKIEQFFLEDLEDINDIVSTTIDDIKKINILTYQSLTSSNRDNDLIYEKILDKWYLNIKSDFKNKYEFIEYVEILKDLDIEDYKENITKYKKLLKNWNEDLVENILSKKVLNYFEKLKYSGIESIVVDEAHHLTSWWSKVIYYLWEWLWNEELNNFNNEYKTAKIWESLISEVLKLSSIKKYSKIANYPLIIGLTATPPYDDIDFFTLDDDYAKLLWEVDYYIPTPAIVKSARLSPWSDLVYFVEPWKDLKITLQKTDNKLELFLETNKDKICDFIFTYLEKNYELMINKSQDRLINYLKFLNTYSDIEISSYFFNEKIWEDILLIDIAKTIWKYISYLEKPKINKLKAIKSKSEINIEKIKKLFYDLGFIWRANNFYKFRTQIENMLVYSKSKINWVKAILDKEIWNLKSDLKCAIITDFLEDRDWIINCKYILKELSEYNNLNPILVSWQWIWKLSNTWELEELDTNILEVTKKLEEAKINLVIWTRGILWEWWDCPSLNTLIDLTWIVAYMSVNQVRWRVIRLDKSNLNKVANIYDIVTYYEGYTKEVDLYRLERKHEKFYWVDDTWLIIRWVDHIYPNIRKNISDFENINENMLKRSTLRSYYYKLWWIWWKYENKEVFWLDLEVKDIWKIIPFVNFRVYDSVSFFKMLWNNDKLKDLNNNYYFELIRRFLDSFITNIVKTQVKLKSLPKGFNFNLIMWINWNFKLISNFKDSLVVKRFILDISTIFTTVIDQKYLLSYPFALYTWESMEKKYLHLPLPKSLSNNKLIRNNFKKEIENDYLRWQFLLGGWYFLFIPNIFSKRLRIIYKYKKLLDTFSYRMNYKNSFNVKYIYLNAQKENMSEFIWKKTFIEAKIEKIWI